MLTKLLILRYLSLVAVFFSFLGSGLMFSLGASKTIESFTMFFSGKNMTETNTHLSISELVAVSLIESVDAFLFALVLLIFAFGIYQIFITKHSIDDLKSVHRWMNIRNISELKTILIEVIIVILFVYFLKNTVIYHDQQFLQMMFLPVSILLLSLSLYFIRKGH